MINWPKVHCQRVEAGESERRNSRNRKRALRKSKTMPEAGPYIAGGRRGQLPPPGKLNVFFLT